jgi:phosphoglucosamine mutase
MAAKKYFGTDGIRGRAGVDPITPEFMLRLGRAIGRVLGDGNATVLIGKDTRISGYMLESALEAGLVAAGADVRLLGPMPTPAVAYLTRALRGTTGIVISASHNPYYDNGIKLFSAQGEKLEDAVELAIERELDTASAPHAPERIGKAARVDDAAQRYLAFCHRTVPGVDLRGKKIAVDCAHGATYHIAPKLLADLGADVIAIGVHPDGYNINKECGATHLLWILASDRHAAGTLKGPVVGTLMTNFGVERAIASLGVAFVRADVGDRYVLQALKQHGGLLGGEASGHLLCMDKVTTGDGIIAALLALDVLQRRGTTLAQARASLRRVPQTTLNIPAAGGAALVARDAVQRALAQAQQTLSGRGRVVLRPSGTEPLVRVTVEGEDMAEVGALASALAEAVKLASESAA